MLVALIWFFCFAIGHTSFTCVSSLIQGIWCCFFRDVYRASRVAGWLRVTTILCVRPVYQPVTLSVVVDRRVGRGICST